MFIVKNSRGYPKPRPNKNVLTGIEQVITSVIKILIRLWNIQYWISDIMINFLIYLCLSLNCALCCLWCLVQFHKAAILIIYKATNIISLTRGNPCTLSRTNPALARSSPLHQHHRSFRYKWKVGSRSVLRFPLVIE